MRFLPILIVTAITLGLCAASASADSIVYAKKGDLYLASPDGSKGYRLTTGGGFSSPSQADNGIIGALRYGKLVRLDRRGRMLNKPVGGMGSPGPGSTRSIGGPYEPRISPDGKRFAYYFYVQSSTDDWENYKIHISTGSYGTWTWADHFTSPATESEFSHTFVQPEWVTNNRLLGSVSLVMNLFTWELGTGHGLYDSGGQWWASFQDPPDEYGVAAFHQYMDPALSSDGTKLAMTDGEGDNSQLVIAATHGPAWSGHAPYPEPDYLAATAGNGSGLPAPTIECATARGKYVNPSWSRDGRLLAYGTSDGVHVLTIPSFDCSTATEHVVAAGGTDPAFGPADVNMADAPRSGRGVRIGHVSVRARSGRLRFTLSRKARVTVMAGGVGIRVRGHRGVNSVRLRFLRGLRPGHYRLTVSAGGSVAATRLVLR